jgi:hypothetical protein
LNTNQFVMKKSFSFFSMLFISFLTFSQNIEDKLAVQAPIDRLFTAMSQGDSAMLHSAFEDAVTMATIATDKSGAPIIRHESSLDGFLKAVGTPHTESWNEPIWDLKINIDGYFAQAWASYAFYRGGKFSHCGVDAFNLFKGIDGKWRIFHLADTRQKEGCKIPKKISDKYAKQ